MTSQVLKSRIIHIDSQDFDTTATELNVLLGKPIMNVQKFKILSFNIPFSFFNITSSNNTFLLTVGANNYTIVLETGNYSCSNIASLLQTKIRALIASSNFYVDFSTNTGKFYFQHSASFTITYSGNTLGQFIKIFNGTSNLVSGAPSNDVISVSVYGTTTNIVVGTNISNILRTPEIQLRTNLTLSLSSTGNSNSDNLLVSVPVSNVSFGSIISTASYPNIMQLDFTPRQEEISEIYISLTDINKQVLDFNGQAYTITFQFFYLE